MLTYYDLELRFPHAAQMLRTGEINRRPKELPPYKDGDDLAFAFDHVFKDEPISAEEEAQDKEWETLARAITAVISAIYYASRDVGPVSQRESGEAFELRSHGERAITDVVNRSWRTLKRRWVTNLLFDKTLQAFVREVVDRHIEAEAAEAELEKSTSEDSEQSNA